MQKSAMSIYEKIAAQRPPSIREEVFKYIRQKILTGEILPGTKLIEARLAEEIGISRTPIREALHNLEMEKLIKSVPRVGYVVSEITKEEVEDILEIRIALESQAAKRAAKHLSPRELKRLEKIILLTEKCIDKNDAHRVVELDTEFHEIICKASKCQRLEQISQTLRDHMLRFRITGLRVPEIARRSNEGHSRIVASLKSKNMRKIVSAVRYHLTWTRKDLIQILD
jgi:DNA-binding GntR family transcriptional regulator